MCRSGTAATRSRRSSPSARLQARGVLRDVGRVLQMPYGQVDKLCKLVPQNPAQPGDAGARDRRTSRELQAERDDDPVVKRAFDIAQKLEGLNRHASTHAAGIVIGDRAADRTGAALSRSEVGHAGDPVQHEMGRAGGAGEVRLPRPEDADRARDAPSKLVQPARHRHRPRRNSRSTTPKPTRCWRAAKRSACSRWKAQGMRRALIDMRPDRFEDIIALVALYRPGPMANIPTYCARKHGDEQPDYIHPKLEPILRETFGVIVYRNR